MGQLEKYGLYVLCLVIFLILGVAIWGGDPNPVLAGTSPGAGVVSTLDNKLPTPKRDLPGKEPFDPEILQPVKHDTPLNGGTQGKAPEGEKKNDGTKTEPPAAPAIKDDEQPKYVVKDKDTFDSIAKEKFGAGSLSSEIMKLNKDIPPKRLHAGMTLVLPSKKAIEALRSPAAKPELAKTDVAKLDPAKATPKTEPKADVKLDPKADPKLAATNATRTYKVKAGESFTSIAKEQLKDVKRTNDLLALNKSIDPLHLRPGMEIKLPAK